MIFGTVSCLGDSLLHGARRQGRGVPELLPEFMPQDGTEWIGLNRAISGETTWQILQRAPAAARELAGLPGAKWCVFLAGTNDTKGAGSGMPLVVWWRNYTACLHWLRRYDLPTVVCTIPPLRPDVMPCYTRHSMAMIKGMNEAIRSLESPTLRVAELEDMPLDHLCDGVHWSDAGIAFACRRIVEAMAR